MSGTTCSACGAAVEDRPFCSECGARLAAGERALVDGRYELGEEIGHGGMGIVHRARDVELDRPVAVKLILPALTRAPEVLNQFRREARALASVQSPHVVRIYAFGMHRGSAFFAMEYVEGEDLGDVIAANLRRRELVPLDMAMRTLGQVAQGLDAVHAAGLVHRDVKPDNVLVERTTGRPVLVDFGLALAAMQQSGEFIAVGTPHYMAPEHAAGGRIGPASDVYAFACSAYEVLTGRLPFDAVHTVETIRMHMMVEPPPPSRWRRELAPLDRAFARALDKTPSARHATAGEFAAELERALGVAWHVPVPRGIPGDAPDERPLVLVVTGDAALAKVCGRALALALFGARSRVVTTRTAEDAESRIRAQAPCLLILDPELEGDATLVAETLRAHPDGTDARLVLARAPAESQRAAWRRLRGAEVLPRPDDFSVLLRELERLAIACGLGRGAAPAKTRR